MSEEVRALLQKIRKGSIETTVRHLVKFKNENGRIPGCTYNNALESLASINVVMNSQALRQRVSRASNEASDNPPPAEEIQITQEDSQISSLTPPTLPKVDNNTDPKASKAGRPKGATNTNKRETEENYKTCVHTITKDYSTLFSTKKLQGKRLPNGALTKIIQSHKKKYQIATGISHWTIRSRTHLGQSETPDMHGVAFIALMILSSFDHSEPKNCRKRKNVRRRLP